jgi:hypothetical protein
MIRQGIGAIQSPTGFLNWSIYWDGANSSGYLYPALMGGAQGAQPIGVATAELFSQVLLGPCRLRNLRANLAFMASTQTQTITLRLGGVDQLLTCQIPAGQRTASDLDVTHELVLSGAFNLLSCRKVGAALDGANTYGLVVSVEVMPL